MRDQFSEVMQRLHDIYVDIPDIVSVSRDRGALPTKDQTPGIILLDGDEKLRTNLDGMNFREMPPAVFTMMPQTFLVLRQRDDASNTTLEGASNPVWTELYLYRRRIVTAVIGDEDLVAMLGDNGSVEYRGFDSDMKSGSTMGVDGATMQFHFAISYVLDVRELS